MDNLPPFSLLKEVSKKFPCVGSTGTTIEPVQKTENGNLS